MKRTFVVLFFSIVMSCTVLGMKRRAGGHESLGMPRVKRNMGGDLYHRLQIIKFFGNCDNCKVMSLREVTNSPEIGFSMCKYEEEKDFVNTTRKEWEAMSVFSAFAQEMSRLSIGDDPTKLIALARSLMKAYAVYEAECEEIRFFVRENSDFYFCCGLVAYYLGEAKDVEDIKAWFEKLFGKAMTREYGFDLIQEAPGESAYFFMKSLEDSDDDRM